jgi:hypothetical protein
MPLSYEARPNDEQLELYVLGLLGEEDTDRLDEASIADDDVAARLRIVENDLIDSYVRGTLERPALERFESYYLSSPRRRANVSFAAKLLPAVDRAAAGADYPAAADPVASRGKFAWRLTVAAALLFVACGALLFEGARRIRVTTDAAAKLERQPLDSERDGGPTTSVVAGPVAPVAASEPGPLAIVLLPQTRAVGPVPAFTVSSDTEHVAFELRLESNDFRRYRAGLKDPATNLILWRSVWTAATASTAGTSVRVVLPSAMLKAQHYSLDLAGDRRGGGGEVIASYAFHVLPR